MNTLANNANQKNNSDQSNQILVDEAINEAINEVNKKTKKRQNKDAVWRKKVARYLAYCVDGGHLKRKFTHMTKTNF